MKKIKKSNKIVIIGVIIFVLIIFSAIYFQQQTKPEKIVKIGYVEGIFNLHNWVAQDKGIFEKNGVKVEFVKFQSSNQVADALLTDKIDVAGIIASEVILSVEEKQPSSFSIFYCFTFDKENPVTNIVVRDESINNIDDLDGKKMALFPGSMPIQLHEVIMRNIGSDAEITLVSLIPPLWLAALESGQVDAVLTFLPFEIVAEDKGIGRILIPAVWETYVADPFIGSCAAFDPEFVRENPKLAEKIFVSIDEAVQFIENNDAEAKRVITNHLPFEEKIVEKIKMPKWRKASEIENRMQNFIDVLHGEGLLEKRLVAGDLLYR